MSSRVGMDMTIDVVNSNDHAVGTVKRKNVLSKGLNFRTVHIFILNTNEDRILLQQLSSNRRRNPGYFGSSVAAYLFSEESYHDAATRRLYQELGVKSDYIEFHWCGKDSMKDKQSLKFVGLYKTIYEGSFNIDRDHIKSITWKKISNIDRLFSTEKVKFTPTFRHVWSIFKNSSCYEDKKR